MNNADALEIAKNALEHCLISGGDKIVADELQEAIAVIDGLRAGYEPHIGDENASDLRMSHPLRCSNCDYTWGGIFLPSKDNRRAAALLQRGSFCPRCHATEGVQIAFNEGEGLPSSFTAKVDQVRFGEKESRFGLSSGVYEQYTIEFTMTFKGNSKSIASAYNALRRSDLTTITPLNDKNDRPEKVQEQQIPNMFRFRQ